jgi:phage terminase large subunit-like protein
MTRGERVCAFIEKYIVIPEGEKVGHPLILEEFQRKFILDVYDNPHGTKRAILSMARKNAKTALIACLLIAHIAGPEAVLNSQIVSGAMSREQAAVVFDLACKMIQLSDVLSKLISIKPSGRRLIGLRKNVTYKALSADSRTAQGLSPVLAIIDEAGQIVGPRSKFVDAIVTAQGAYKNAMVFVISTQAETDNDWFSRQIDSALEGKNPRVVCHLYAAQDGCAIDDIDALKASNPALGKFRSLEDAMDTINEAIEIPSQQNSVRNLILNQRISVDSPFASKAVWMLNSESPGDKPQGKVWCGLDLSAVNDLTAFVAVDETGGIFPTFWLPKEGILEKSKREKVPYDLWHEQGYLQLCEGKAIEYSHIAKFLREFFDENNVQLVGFDRYLMNFLREWLVIVGFSDDELDRFIAFGQGTASMTPALRELEVRLINGKMKHGNHPVMNMCLANAKVVGDSDARKFDKKKARGRIDGMSALANAVGVMPIDSGNTQSFWAVDDVE